MRKCHWQKLNSPFHVILLSHPSCKAFWLVDYSNKIHIWKFIWIMTSNRVLSDVRKRLAYYNCPILIRLKKKKPNRSCYLNSSHWQNTILFGHHVTCLYLSAWVTIVFHTMGERAPLIDWRCTGADCSITRSNFNKGTSKQFPLILAATL
jgi:hypothetical protein